MMDQLNLDIKNQTFKPIYLLYGEETYLLRQFKQRFRKAMLPPEDTMNYAYYEGDKMVLGEVLDFAQTLPFFAERRLLIIENCPWFSDASDKLLDFLKQLPETTNLIFVEKSVDKRSRLYKTLKDLAYVCELKIPNEQMLLKWVILQAKEAGKVLDSRTANMLLQKVGVSMDLLTTEVAKLVSYVGERETITAEDIEAICVPQIDGRIFDMVEAVAKKEVQKAIAFYYDLLSLKEPPLRILSLMMRQYRLMYQVKLGQQKGWGKAEIASKFGIHPYATGIYMNQAKSYELATLREAMEAGAEVEERIKTGLSGDVLAVESFMIERAL